MTSASRDGLTYRHCDLDELRAPWQRLLTHVPRPSFHHHLEWHAAIREHLVPATRYSVFLHHGEAVAIFPLAPRGSAPRELALPSHVEIFLRDCLIAQPFLGLPWRSLLQQHVRGRRGSVPVAIRMDRVPAGACAANAFREGARGVRRTQSDGRMFCSVEDPRSVAALPTKHRRNVDRLRRRAERDFGRIEWRSFNQARAVDGLDLFVGVEAEGWKGPAGSGTSLSCQPVVRAFYRSLLRAFGTTHGARIDVLTLDDVPAAALLALQSGHAWHLLKIGFDERFAACGPGNILLMEFIERMASDPDILEVSLVTAPSWGLRWHMEEEPEFDIAVFPGTLRGRARCLRFDARHAARRLLVSARKQRSA